MTGRIGSDLEDEGRAIRAPVCLAILLAFIASYVDTVSFISLFSLFTTHVTGNFVVIAAALLGRVGGLPTKLFAVPVLMAAVALAQLVHIAQPQRPRRAALQLIAAQISLLIAFMGLGLNAEPIQSASEPAAVLTGLVGVFAMGLQNALGHTPLCRALPPTTSMTGNVTVATMDLVNALMGSSPSRRLARQKFLSSWLPILAFGLGAAAATLAFSGLGFWSLLAPILLLGLVAGLVSEPV